MRPTSARGEPTRMVSSQVVPWECPSKWEPKGRAKPGTQYRCTVTSAGRDEYCTKATLRNESACQVSVIGNSAQGSQADMRADNPASRARCMP